MPVYKLDYFDARGLAEPIRWIFAYREIPFEDNRIHTDDWAIHVQGYSWGVLPILFEDGLEFAQSCSIARYLARKYNLDGNTPYESHLCDQYVDHIFDWLKEFGPWYLTRDKAARETERKRILKDVMPKNLRNFDRVIQLRDGRFLLGDHVSYADFYLANFLAIFEGKEFVGPTLLDDYPALRTFKEHVFAIEGIKKQVEANPNASLCCDQCQKWVKMDS